jgi:hypothetical protein
MSTVTYFAYGSNMSSRRLRARVPSASPVGIGTLTGWSLAFHKAGRDGSGKCSIVAVDSARVLGVLFSLRATELVKLDLIEGRGFGYERRMIEIATGDGLVVEAQTYIATRIGTGLRPYSWYKRHVLEGALEAGLPAYYITTIQAVEAIEDDDLLRVECELGVYGT